MIFKFDTLQLIDEANGLAVLGHEVPDKTRIPFESAPRRHGVIVTEEPTLEERVLTFNGIVRKSTAAALRTWIDDSLKVLNQADKNFYLYDATRYIVCTKADFSWRIVPGSGGLVLEYDCELFGKDPFWYSSTAASDVQTITNWPTSATSWVHTNTGSAFVYPTITVTANISGSISSITFTNSTTGKSWSFSGTILSGNSLVFDCANFTVTNNAVSALAQLTGVPIHLVSGANTLSFSGGNATVTVAYTPRSFGP